MADWMALLLGLGIVFFIIAVALYVYTSLALMTIAKKTKTPNPWLAWIPIGNFYLMTQIAKVPWWTMLIIFLAWIPVIGSIAMVAVMCWWWWKIAEARNKPGFFGILAVLVPIVNLIFMGIIAWSDK